MPERKCPICKGRMSSYGHDGLICIECGFVIQEPTVSGKSDVVWECSVQSYELFCPNYNCKINSGSLLTFR